MMSHEDMMGVVATEAAEAVVGSILGPDAQSRSLFEVVDTTNEETYWTLGIWLTLQEALTALDLENPEDVGCNEADGYDDYRAIEVRERKIGWGGAGKRVAKVEWQATWDEPSDEYKWARVQGRRRQVQRLSPQRNRINQQHRSEGED